MAVRKFCGAFYICSRCHFIARCIFRASRAGRFVAHFFNHSSERELGTFVASSGGIRCLEKFGDRVAAMLDSHAWGSPNFSFAKQNDAFAPYSSSYIRRNCWNLQTSGPHVCSLTKAERSRWRWVRESRRQSRVILKKLRCGDSIGSPLLELVALFGRKLVVSPRASTRRSRPVKMSRDSQFAAAAQSLSASHCIWRTPRNRFRTATFRGGLQEVIYAFDPPLSWTNL